MTEKKNDHDGPRPSVAILAVPAVTASTVYGMYDLFTSVGRDWDLVTTGNPGRGKAHSFVVAERAGLMRAANGVPVEPDYTFADCPKPDIVCIPDLLLPPEANIAGRYGAAVEWLRECHTRGATLASACSGALLLAEAGLLDGGDATTHWGYCDTLGAKYPKVRMHPSRVLVATGDGQRIITSGGGTSWQDLTLFLIARAFGADEARQLARLHLMEWHSHGQLPYSSLASTRQVEDRTIAACQEWVADHYAEPHPVAGMARLSGLAERSFKRRFTKVTGMAPLEYVHTLRLEEAKQILETTDLAVEAVAVDLGYEDASFFRRLFRRKVGMTPREYRRRFATIHRALRSSADGGGGRRLFALP